MTFDDLTRGCYLFATPNVYIKLNKAGDYLCLNKNMRHTEGVSGMSGSTIVGSSWTYKGFIPTEFLINE